MARILIIDDNQINREMLALHVGKRGHEALVAEDGADGVAAAREQLPDLVLVDMSMPVMDGWTATRILKADPLTREIPVIGLTAHASEEVRRECLEAGCDDYETKPVDFPRLFGKIDARVGRRSQAVAVDRLPGLQVPDPAARLRHDLCNRVGQIIGHCELLRGDAERDGNRGYLPDLEKILTAAHAMLVLIREELIPETFGLVTGEPVVAGGSMTEKGTFAVELDPTRQLRGRVLAVDDDADNLEVLARLLERDGLSVAKAGDGITALAMMRAEPFDVVLLDIMMPAPDGFEVLRRIKNDPVLAGVPVIMVSAIDDLQAMVRCIESGADDYLPKPFNPALIRTRLGACLGKVGARLVQPSAG